MGEFRDNPRNLNSKKIADLTNAKTKVGSGYVNNLQKRATKAEVHLNRLLAATTLRYKFQKLWTAGDGFYISDFYFFKSHCAIEVDGGYHETIDAQIQDSFKETYLAKRGVRTIRIVNEEALDLDKDSIIEWLTKNKII